MHHFIGILAITIASAIAAPTSGGAGSGLSNPPTTPKPGVTRIDYTLLTDSHSSGCDWTTCETSYSHCLRTCNSLRDGDW